MVSVMVPDELTIIIRQEAHQAGFDLCGITDAIELAEPAIHLKYWLAKGCHGQMSYMGRNPEKRTNPSLLVTGAKTVIVVGLNYYSVPGIEKEGEPVISRYASGVDYHIVVKKKLKALLASLKLKVPHLEGRVFSDTAPLMEKALAVKAGLGSQGKNSLLLSKSSGSFFFLGELVINLEAKYDKPYTVDQCGSCSLCIESCPTGAITDHKYIDARKCISYHTVELRGKIPDVFKGKLGNRVFGCDICQDVCPHNQSSKPHNVPEFTIGAERASMTPEKWHSLTPMKFSSLFRETSVYRCGYEKFMENMRF